MDILQKCPICNHSEFELFLKCEDFTSSHEQFNLCKCLSCALVFTNPRPDRDSLPIYYQSNQYISHTGKSTGILDRIYLLARNLTLRWKINLIKKQKGNPISILDYGCGTGAFLQASHRQGWKIAGLEPSPEARQKATKITGINIADNLAEFNQKFDVITLWHVLEHVMDLNQTLTNLTALLKEDGIIIIAVPNHDSYDASFYKQHWAAYDVPRHLWHFTKTTMAALLQLSNLKIKYIKPMKLDAFYVSLLSEKYSLLNRTSVLSLLKGTIRAIISNQLARSSKNYSSLIYIVTK